MKQSVTPVQMWKCSATGKLFSTPEEAEKSFKAAKARAKRKKDKEAREKARQDLIEYQSNYVRLNAGSFDDIPLLIKAKAKEFWGIELDITCTGVIFTTREFKGWTFDLRVSGEALGREQFQALRKINPNVRTDIQPAIGDIIFCGRYYDGNPACFKGIHFICGSGCRFGGTNPMRMQAKAALKDFPILAEKYERYSEIKPSWDRYNSQLGSIYDSAVPFALSTRAVVEQKAFLEALRDQLKLENKKYDELCTAAKKVYTKFCISKLVPPIAIPEGLVYDFERNG